MIFKNFKWIWVILALAGAVWCIGCSGSDDSTTSEQGDDFHHTPPGDVQARIEDLKRLFPEETYDKITAKSRDNSVCVERNREQLDLPGSPNGEWYYTYENLIKGMAELVEFADDGDENTKKLEIAAFLANIAQETGAKISVTHLEAPVVGYRRAMVLFGKIRISVALRQQVQDTLGGGRISLPGPPTIRHLEKQWVLGMNI